MAKSKEFQWKEEGIWEENLETMQSLSRQGVHLATIAKALGINERTLLLMRKRDPEVKEALRKGVAHSVAETGKLLMAWAYDEDVPVDVRIALVKDLNKRQTQRLEYLEATENGDGIPQLKSNQDAQFILTLSPSNKKGGEGVDGE